MRQRIALRQRIGLRHRMAVVLGATGVAIGLAAQAVAAGNEPPAPGPAHVEPSVWAEGSPPGRLVIPPSLPPGAAEIVADRVARDGSFTTVWRHAAAGEAAPTLPSNPFSIAGFYRFTLRSTDGDAPIATFTVSVVPSPLPRGTAAPLFGVNTHFAQRDIPDRAYGLLRLANVDLIRDQWTWSALERQRDRLVAPLQPSGGIAHARAELSESGIRILHDCAYTNPLYDDNRFPQSDEAVHAFARYCAFVAQQFGPTLYGSEIWNESNTIDAVKTYAPLARATSQALRASVPRSAILQGGGAGAGGGADPFYEESVFKTIGPDCCTGDSVHPYMTNPDVGYFADHSRLINPVTQQSIVNVAFVSFWTDYLSHLYKLDRGSNFTEIGWSTAGDGKDGVSEEKQAAYVSRLLIDASEPSACTRSSGVSSRIIDTACTPTSSAVIPDLRSVFVYDFQDDGADPNNREHNFGLLHQDLSPKMSYSAYAQATGVLRGTEFAGSIPFGPRSLAHALMFHDSTRVWLMLWTAELVPDGIVKSAAELRFPRDTRTRSSVTVEGAIDACREWDGHPCDIPADHRLEITNLPIFLRLIPGRETIAVREEPHV